MILRSLRHLKVREKKRSQQRRLRKNSMKATGDPRRGWGPESIPRRTD